MGLFKKTPKEERSKSDDRLGPVHKQLDMIPAGEHPSLAQSGWVSSVAIRNHELFVVLTLPLSQKELKDALFADCQEKLDALGLFNKTHIIITAESEPEANTTAAARPARWNVTPLPHVKRIIAVASGKGGVGKSTSCVSLARAATALGQRAAILDADIYGPSIPRLMGLMGKKQPEAVDNMMMPHESHSIACMSIGFLISDQAAILRGPMVSKALQQMLRNTQWGTEDAPVDVLFIDMPPGTGDIALSLAQQAPLNGAIIVTTPQELATADASKAAIMFEKVDVPILGIVENMSYFEDPSGEKHALFGEGGGQRMAEQFSTRLLASVPMIQGIEDPFSSTEEATAPYKAIVSSLLSG